MTPAAGSYIRNRLLLAAILVLLAVCATGLFFPVGKPNIVLVRATVLEVNQGHSTGFRTSASLITARVRLPDGRKTRVLVQGTVPREGEVVILREAHYANGERRYRMVREPLDF